MPLSSHTKRILTAAILLPVLLAALYLGGWAIFIVVLVVSSAGLLEFYAMFWKDGQQADLKAAAVVFAAALLICAQMLDIIWGFGFLMAAFWCANLIFLLDYSRNPEKTSYLPFVVFTIGLVYIPGTLQCFLLFTRFDIILVLLATFASDTGAFYAGKFIGGQKIWPEISPKKTWAGSIGGLVLCIAAITLYGLLAPSTFRGSRFGITPPYWIWPLTAITLNLACQFGDFFESALKRSLKIKDSGSLLPGHGGILDRIDGLLLTTPAYALLLIFSTYFLE